MPRDKKHSHTWHQLGKGEGDSLTSTASDCHMREEGPPSGWRPEGLSPSNWLRPRSGGGGGRPGGQGGARNLSITESAGAAPTTLQYLGKAVPGREGRGRGRRGQAGGSQSAGRREGVGAGSPRATQTHRPRRTLGTRCSSAFRCEGQATSCPPGHPYRCGPDRSLPFLRGGSATTVAGKHASLFPSLSRPSLTRHPFFLFFR